MNNEELRDLLRQARVVMERYLFEGEDCRDRMVEICRRIDAAFAKELPIRFSIESEESMPALV